MKLHHQITIALILATVAGLFTNEHTTLLGINVFGVYAFLGALFLQALKMIVVPLVISSIVCGIANVSSQGTLGRMGYTTLTFYILSSLIAILIGLVAVNLFEPGIKDGIPVGELLNLDLSLTQGLIDTVGGRGIEEIVYIFQRMIPSNIIASMAHSNMLAIIFFALLFGFYAGRIKSNLSASILTFFTAVQDIMIHITFFVMRFAPIGVFGLVAKAIGNTGLEAFIPLITFFVTVMVALGIHMFISYPIVLKFLANTNPWTHMSNVAPALLTAFSTSSSAATLPVTMDNLERRAGVSKKTTGFVLPLGATVNMDGTALYECVAAMFIAQAYGLELGATTQFIIVITALLTSIGVAGVPKASLVAIGVILTTIGLPLEGLGLLLVTDRLLDMCRTTVNVFGDTCCAKVVDKVS